MQLTEATRDLLLSRLDELNEELDLLDRLIKRSEEEDNDEFSPEFNQFRRIKIDIKTGEKNRIRSILIKNDWKWEN